MTAKELQRIGKDLFGEAWKGKLATAIGRSRFTIYRWAKDGVTCAPAIELLRTMHKQQTKEG